MRRLPKKNTNLKHFVKNAVLKIIYSSNFDEQEILYKNLITVLSYKNNCKQTIMAKSNLRTNPVTFDFEEVNETVMEENFEIISANSPNKDKVSAYYQKFKKITDDVIEKGNTLKTQHKNNLYNPEFVHYFVEYCIPIMPLWSNTLVRKANVELKQQEQLMLTNATVESTFAYEKKYIFKRDHRFKVKEFVKTYSSYMKSKLKKYNFEWKHEIKNKSLKKNISETKKKMRRIKKKYRKFSQRCIYYCKRRHG
ncbi:UNVERIFIED_CONTAM: hypothetical protein RMT77_019077 [Armadillidium vulgare]